LKAIAFQEILDELKVVQERIRQLEFDSLKRDIAEGQRAIEAGEFDSFTRKLAELGSPDLLSRGGKATMRL
jgi:hypothetical protein